MSLKAQKDKPNLKLAAELPPTSPTKIPHHPDPQVNRKLQGKKYNSKSTKATKDLNTTEALKATLQENQRQTET